MGKWVRRLAVGWALCVALLPMHAHANGALMLSRASKEIVHSTRQAQALRLLRPITCLGTRTDAVSKLLPVTRQAFESTLPAVTASHSVESSIEAAFTVQDLLKMLDPYHAGHSQRVGNLASATAERMELGPEVVEDVRVAARLHDVGKTSIPGDVLFKPGALNEAEYEVMKTHAEKGDELLQIWLDDTPRARRLRRIVRGHHERFDGSGYPDGLTGEAIPIGARVTSVSDAFDAMTTQRVYNTPMSVDEAAARLLDGAGTQFDPDVVNAFIAVLRERGILGH